MNNQEADLSEHEKPAISASCSDKTVSLYVPHVNSKPESAYQAKLALDIPVCIRPPEKYSPERSQDSAIESQQNSQEMKERQVEQNIQLNDFSSTKKPNSLHSPGIQTKQPKIASEIFAISCAGNLGVCFNEITGKQESTTILPSMPLSGPVPIIPFTRISIGPPSDPDHRVPSEGLLWQHSAAKQNDCAIVCVNQEVSGQDITTEETAPLSPLACHISSGGKGQIQGFDMFFQDTPACQHELLNAGKENNVTKEAGVEVLNVSTHICPEQTEQTDSQHTLLRDNQHTLLQGDNQHTLLQGDNQHTLLWGDNQNILPQGNNPHTLLSPSVLKSERSQITDTSTVFTNLEPHENMEEINLNEVSVHLELEKNNSVNVEPQQLHIDLTKYTELFAQRKAAVNFLKRSVVKSVMTHGTKLKDVVSEKLNFTKFQEPATPSRFGSGAESLPSCLLNPSNLNIAMTGTPRRDATPCLSNHESKNTYEQKFHDNSFTGVDNKIDEASVIQKGSVAMVTHGSGLCDRNLRQLVPSAPLAIPQFNSFNIPFHNCPQNSVSYLRSTVTQSPGPMRGYNAFYSNPYGFPMPPSLPPPPSVPAMEYFANRYCTSQHSTLNTVPTMFVAPPTIDRARFSQMETPEPTSVRCANYVSSLLHLKSNKARGSLHRKLSSSLLQTTSRACPEADYFMEEGRVQRSSRDNESDQFRCHRLRMFTSDDLLIGAMCCCCWPLGLAARLVTLTMPDSNGPVDSCVKAMSHQINSVSLVLGIASYFVFFVLWLSLFAVAAK